MATTLISGLGGPAGFGENALAVGDDNDSGFIDLRHVFPRGINVFGTVYQGLFVNNNGSVSFGASLDQTARFALTSGKPPFIAPLLADVDTRGGAIAPSPGGTSTGANRVWYDLDAASGTVTVTWDDVGRFASQTDAANAFQLRLTSVPSPGGVHDGNFDIEFRYEAITWDTSTSGRASYAVISDGNGVNILHLPGAAGVLALDEGSNGADPGRFAFRSREGVIEPEFSVGPMRIVEGSGIGPRMAEITIQRTSAVSAASVSYATESATALPYLDYLPRSGIVFFKPGMSSQTILVPVIQDSVPEGAEQFLIRLSNPNGGALTNPTGLVQIDDDDLAPPATPSLALYAAPTRESAGSMLFTATLSAPQASPLVASYSLAGGTASTADFDSTGGTITFAPGTTKASFAVPLVSDTEVEAIQEFSAILTSDAVKVQTAFATGTILDDDGFSVADVVVTEGAGGTFAEFTVTLGSALAEVATVSFGTSSGTAFQGLDYTPLSGTLTFAPGITSQAVKVAIIGDTDNPEPNEQFSLVLSAPSPNTGIVVGKARALIIDDDGISVGDAKVTEINGDTFVDVLITLPAPSAVGVSVDWATAFGTAGFFDFDANATGSVFFSPGDTSETISILVKADKAFEGNETFRVVLSNPQGSTITDGSGTVTIVDDESSLVIVDIADHEAIDAAGGDVKVAMTVFLNRLHSLPVTVDVALFENGATKGVDYIDAPGTVTIPAGQISATFDVTLLRADQPEALENITLAISNPSGGAVLPVPEGVPSATANLAIQGYATMFDLALPAISDARENEWAAAPPVYTLTRRGDMTSQQVVGWAVDYNPGRSSIDSNDLAADQGLVTFAPGQETATFSVDVVGDTNAEGLEFFTLQLVDLPAGSAAGVLPITGISILNDDTTMNLRGPSFPYVGLENGAGPISTPVFSVEVAGDLSVPRTVTWTITGFGPNPADAADFKAMTGTVSIPAKADLVKFTVPVFDDSTIEPTEAYTVTLSDAGKGVTFINASASSFIANDDYKAALSIAKATQLEGSSGGSTAYAFTITLDPAPPRNFAPSFSWKVGPGTVPGTVSADAADFGGFLPSGTVAVGLSAATATIIVPVAADTAAELNESFTLTVTDNATGLAIGKASATILNDDTNLSIAATSANKPEGSGPAPTPYTFTVTRTGNLSLATTAKWSAAGISGSGTLPANAADFPGGVLPSGTVSFAAGQKTQLITVNVAADRTVEANERFAVTLSSPSPGATLATASAGAIIQNDDKAGTGALSIARLRASRSEGQSGSTDFTFQVTRAGSLTGPAGVDWSVTGGGVSGTGGATASDFAAGVLPTGSVTFAQGENAKLVTIAVKGDTAAELNESFTVTLANASQGAALGTASATGLVWNDDSAGTGTLSIARLAAQKIEGSSGTTAFTFTVSRTGVLTGTASADWAVSGGGVSGTNPAGAGDFAGGQLPSGRVAFLAGQASTVVTVNVAGDIAAELNESFTVTLSGAQAGVALGTATANGTILNDDIVSTPASQALRGTAGIETFVLGGGIDTVLALGGRDLFLFQPGALGDGATNAAFIGDFSPAAGETLDLSAIDAIEGGANDAFTFIGNAAFTGPGQLRWDDLGTLRGIFGSTDADATPELSIFLSNPGPVQANWFVL